MMIRMMHNINDDDIEDEEDDDGCSVCLEQFIAL